MIELIVCVLGEYYYVFIFIWMGNIGIGISGYCDYCCDVIIEVVGKLEFLVLFDKLFCGDLF